MTHYEHGPGCSLGARGGQCEQCRRDYPQKPKRWEQAYAAWQRAVRARSNRVLRGTPTTYAEDKRAWQRIADLKARYEALLEEEKHAQR